MRINPTKMSVEALEALEASIMAELQSRYIECDKAPLYEAWRD